MVKEKTKWGGKCCTFLSARARRLLSSFPGMASRLSRAHLKARLCKARGMSEALTRTLRWSCCSVAFFFCMRLLRNLLLLSSSSSAPPISIFSHYETNKLSTTCNFPQPRVTVFLLLFSQCICGIHEAAGLGAADKIIVWFP